MYITAFMQISLFCIAIDVIVITKFLQFKVSQLDVMFYLSKSSFVTLFYSWKNICTCSILRPCAVNKYTFYT